MDDLVKRLRGYGTNRCWPHGPACDCTQAADRIEALERQVKAADALAEHLERWTGVAANCVIESGVCCCGDDMNRHGSPLNCRHSPVDHGAYVATQLVDDTTSALATYRAAREADT